MIWEKEHDGDDNSLWNASSCYQDDGVSFKFRVRPELANDAVWWYVGLSDVEVLPDGAADLRFAGAEEAKRWCEHTNAAAEAAEMEVAYKILSARSKQLNSGATQ